MWVYRGSAAAKRAALNPQLGNWLDYWLFLTADETYPAWRLRPLSLSEAVALARLSGGHHNRTLRAQIAEELEALRAVAHYLPSVPSLPQAAPLTNGSWHNDWVRWMETVTANHDSDATSVVLIESLVAALRKKNIGESQFLSRRLACELNDGRWSARELFTIVNRTICESGTFDGGAFDEERLREALCEAFTPRRLSPFLVRFELAPTRISRHAAGKFYLRSSLILSDGNERDETDLVGAVVEVDARSVSAAVVEAREVIIELLEDLRLVFYVRSHVCGSIEVIRADTGIVYDVPLPQPFWPKSQAARREVPRLPRLFRKFVEQLDKTARPRWQAACWHLSQAFSDWPEDPHIAASHVWQALESFRGDGSGWLRVLDLVPEYVNGAVRDVSTYFARGVAEQAYRYKEQTGRCDWYVWKPRKNPLEIWMERVLSRTSGVASHRWTAPVPPAFVFDRDHGALPLLRSRQTSGTPSWIDRRLESDLKLLYGIRNAAVHRGERVGSARLATYLAVVGAEMLLSIMQERARTYSV